MLNWCGLRNCVRRAAVSGPDFSIGSRMAKIAFEVSFSMTPSMVAFGLNKKEHIVRYADSDFAMAHYDDSLSA